MPSLVRRSACASTDTCSVMLLLHLFKYSAVLYLFKLLKVMDKARTLYFHVLMEVLHLALSF